ncbi:MAG: c-type cytochrome [Deltaproteobacteria bacterium]|nr:c-type cytochrome [Deltaproteobacteria bacterium]
MKVLKGKKGLTVLFTALFLLLVSFSLYGCAKKPAAPAKPAKKVKKAAKKVSKTSKVKVKIKAKTVSALKPAAANLKTAALKIINAQGCEGCHVINGKGGTIGPNLDKEGTKGHSIHWLEVQINTPKVHDKTTMMPNHNLNPTQLKTVAEYLESLK